MVLGLVLAHLALVPLVNLALVVVAGLVVGHLALVTLVHLALVLAHLAMVPL